MRWGTFRTNSEKHEGRLNLIWENTLLWSYSVANESTWTMLHMDPRVYIQMEKIDDEISEKNERTELKGSLRDNKLSPMHVASITLLSRTNTPVSVQNGGKQKKIQHAMPCETARGPIKTNERSATSIFPLIPLLFHIMRKTLDYMELHQSKL